MKIISNHSMPNILVGKISMAQDLLKASLHSKKNDVVPFKFAWDQNSLSYANVGNSRCIIEFSSRHVLDKTFENSRLATPQKSDYANSFYSPNKNREEDLTSKINSNFDISFL